jgi:23S rRNA (uracil1939-C5)-methyltransferase
MKPHQIFRNVEIFDISTEGKGIGRIGNIVCFVDFAVPGDVTDIQITRKKSNYYEGKIINIRKYSEKRTTPVCKHFGICGGCKWQNLNYEAQLIYKQKYVEDAITRIAKIQTTILPIIPSKHIYQYRNKLEFTFSNKKWFTSTSLPQAFLQKEGALGFHIPKFYDKVLDIEECHLQEEPSNAIRLEIKKFAVENKWEFYDIKQQTGFLRNLIIRNTSIGEWMVVIVFFYDIATARESLLNHLQRKFPQITSLQYVINPKKNDSIHDLEVITFAGKTYIEEQMEGLKFRIGSKSFFQTNSLHAYELYKVTRDFAELKGNELVYDLYTGIGTIAHFIARSAKKVIGIEYIPEAIEDAKINSTLNNISNTEFLAGDIKEILTDNFISVHGRPNVIITDPPRAGMHESVVKKILEICPERIIYVSCNPATQARDISILSKKYSVEKVQPIDMFPHTAHVENVVKLVLK